AELHDSRPFLTTPGSRSRPGLRDPSPGRAHPSSIATGCPDPCAGWDPGGDVTGRGRYVSDRVRTPEDRRTFAVGHVRRPAVHRPDRTRRGRGPVAVHEPVGHAPGEDVGGGRAPPRA